MKMAATLALVTATVLASSTAQARHYHHHRTHIQTQHHRSLNCVHNTIRVSTAYNIDICVDPRFASNFQAFFASLHATGARVTDIVCQAYGHANGSNHIGGGACDVNQRAKNRTIPAMYHAGSLIRAAGLYDGCSFRDCGHVEAMRGLHNYDGGRVYATRHRKHVRVASTYPNANVLRLGAGL